MTTISHTTSGRPDVTTLSNGWTIGRDYDSAGRVTRITADDGTTTGVDLEYDYTDGSGDTALVQTLTDHRQNHTTTYTYDVLDRLTDAVTTAGGTPIATYGYDYDPAGNMTSRTTPAGTTTLTYNDANMLTGIGAATVTNDTAGNQTATSTGDAYTYDDADRPTSITAGGTGPLTATYRGDDAVERASLGTTTSTTSLLGVTAQTTGSSTTGYTRTPTGQVHSIRSPGGAIHYVLPDRLGSTMALVNDTGTLTTRYAYSPYGQTTITSLGSGHITQPYRYTGQHQDPTGLYKM
jgi:YD repeat-containing protein